MPALSPIAIVSTLTRRYGWIVAICGLAGGLVAGTVAMLTPKQWSATQQLIVRDELVGDRGRTGRFASLDEMKTLEETVRTVVRSRRVIGAALADLEPPASYSGSDWPSDEFVEDFRSKVSVTAPNGAEFGHTEVIQLHVTDRSPERAVATLERLIVALGRELSALRQTRLIGIEKELARSLEAADRSLQDASQDLASLEREVGIDIAELRSMTDTNGSEGPLARQLGQTRQDQVQLEQRSGELQTHLQHLQRLLNVPEKIVSTPESLLAIHPELRRLKESIVDSAVTLAQLRAQYDVQHPRVLAAAVADRQLAAELQVQLQSALQGTQLELELIQTRQSQLDAVEKRLTERMLVLAEKRVPYAELAHRVEQRKAQRALIEAEWSDVQAALGEMEGSEIASPLGTPVADPRPSGPGRSTIALAGVAGGIALALAGIALIIDPKTLFSATSKEAAPHDKSLPAPQAQARQATPVYSQEITQPTLASHRPTTALSDTETFDFAALAQPHRSAAPETSALSGNDEPQDRMAGTQINPSSALPPSDLPPSELPHSAPSNRGATQKNLGTTQIEVSFASTNLLADAPTDNPVPVSSIAADVPPGAPPAEAPAMPISTSSTPSPPRQQQPVTAILPIEAGSVELDPEADKWRALVELSDEIAELKRSIERRRAAALAEELARYGSTPSE